MNTLLKSATEIIFFIIVVIIMEYCIKLKDLNKEVKYEVQILGNPEDNKKLRRYYARKKIIKYSLIAGTSIGLLIFVGVIAKNIY